MQIKYFPGTTIPFNPSLSANCFLVISSLCTATGGITLSQLMEMTGLEGTTVQNWVKRAWVSKTTHKKYNEGQIARILIISVLRESLPLEQISGLMSYVNGSVDDMSDDIIDEGELYSRLCAIIYELDENKLSADSIKSAIKEHLADYEGPLPDSKERLFGALRVMVTAYIAAMIKRKSERLCNELLACDKEQP